MHEVDFVLVVMSDTNPFKALPLFFSETSLQGKLTEGVAIAYLQIVQVPMTTSSITYRLYKMT